LEVGKYGERGNRLTDEFSTDWIQTFTGKAFYPLEPEKCIEKICIEDIAWSLSMQCRYAGHSKFFYSVAEHCIHVSNAVSTEYAFEGLMHDASEAYLVDIPRPIKPYILGYYEMEKRLMVSISKVFGLQYPLPQNVKDCDSSILHDERLSLMHEGEKDWYLPFAKIPGINIHCWSQPLAFRYFMQRFYELERSVL